MVKTHGLSHISLIVSDLDRAVRFYTDAFGVREYFRDSSQVQVQGPGPYDVIAFELGDPLKCGTGAITHFGFRLTDPLDIGAAVSDAVRAGGRLLRQGEFAPGFPYAYIEDPDGHEIEIWFE